MIGYVTFFFIIFNIYDLIVNFKSARIFYRETLHGGSILEYCVEKNKPYRLKELILDANNISETIIRVMCNPIRWLNVLVVSVQYSLWRLTKTLSTAVFGGIIISLTLTARVRKINLNIGILYGVNSINSYSILLYTLFIERAFLDAFLCIYLGIKMTTNGEKKSGFNIERILLFYCTGYSIFRISAILSYEKKI